MAGRETRGGILVGVKGVVRYGLDPNGRPLGSRKLGSLVSNQVWLMGDVGIPKKPTPVNVMPVGYYTEIDTYQPTSQGFNVGGSILKQPACRHDGQAAFTFCDGHAEVWKWLDLKNDKNDVFGLLTLK